LERSDERDAGTVGQVQVARRVDHGEICSATDHDPADLAAA
jgi:hypothetical protein